MENSVFVTIELLEEKESDSEGTTYATAVSYTHGLDVPTVCEILRSALAALEAR